MSFYASSWPCVVEGQSYWSELTDTATHRNVNIEDKIYRIGDDGYSQNETLHRNTDRHVLQPFHEVAESDVQFQASIS